LVGKKELRRAQKKKKKKQKNLRTKLQKHIFLLQKKKKNVDIFLYNVLRANRKVTTTWR